MRTLGVNLREGWHLDAGVSRWSSARHARRPPTTAPSAAIPKYVVSATLTDPDWANTTVLSGDIVDQIRELKSQPGQDIVQYGFGALSTLLMENRLLDELRLWIHPLFVGKGSTDDLLFPKAPPAQVKLTSATILENGVAILTYRTS